MSYAVAQGPVTTVSFTTSYYAPLVPMAAAYYAPAAVQAVPVHAVPVYSAPVYGYGHRVHSHLNVYRNGSYNYRLRVR